MKKLRLDLDKLSVNSLIIETADDLRGTVDAASYTDTPTQCSHMNMCSPDPITGAVCRQGA